MLKREQMHAYQDEGAGVIYNRKRLLVLADMGTGKTVMTLSAISDLFDAWKIKNVLIVAPKTVALTTWPDEIEDWEHTKHMSYHVLTGNEQELIEGVEGTHAQITIIGTHRFRWLWENYWQKASKKKAFWRWDCVIIDESSKVKRPSSKVFRAFKSIHRFIPRMYLLTAKPMPNGYIDLWAQAYLIDSGKRLYPTQQDFKLNCFNSNAYTHSLELRDSAKEFVHKAIAELSHRVDAKDHLPLLDATVIDVWVDLNAKQRARYEELENELMLMFDADNLDSLRRHLSHQDEEWVVAEDDVEVEVMSAAALSNKLRQMANGSVYLDKQGTWANEHDIKMEAMDEIIEQAQGRPILIGYGFKSDLQRMQRKYGHRLTTFKTSNARQIVKDWNAGKIPLLAAHPLSVSHGLNMQKGGHLEIFYSIPWDLDIYEQMIGRVLRQGQTERVVIYRLLTRNTIDEAVAAALTTKGDRQEVAIDSIKAYITAMRASR